jgi:D-alanyl-D-alanine carboxypeptidase
LGIKTGITVTAGPCLASAYQFRQKTYIIVLLRAPKISSRFKETRMLLVYVIGKLFNDLNEK